MKMKLPLTLVLSMTLCAVFAQYDTSTPEKYIQSLARVGSGPADENPIPFFYEPTSAAAISGYDQIGAIALANFQSFKTQLATQFSSRVASMTSKEIKLYTDDTETMTRSFSFSGSLIGPQIKQRSASDYEFISATEPDSDKKVTITLKMMGRTTPLEVKDFGSGYKMWMDQETLATISLLTNFFSSCNDLLVVWLKALENKEITDSNFEEKISEWNDQFMQVTALLNK